MKSENHIDSAELLVMIIQSIKGDPFETLIRVCDHVTYGVINKYFFPDYEKEDLLQEARSILMEAALNYKIDGGMLFYQYYHMLLKNHFNSLVRKEYTHKRKVHTHTTSLDQLIEEAGVNIQGIAPVTTYPEDVIIAKESYNKYIIALSPFEKGVFSLFLEGKMQNEIAEELETSSKKVSHALYRCNKKLKTTLNQ